MSHQILPNCLPHHIRFFPSIFQSSRDHTRNTWLMYRCSDRNDRSLALTDRVKIAALPTKSSSTEHDSIRGLKVHWALLDIAPPYSKELHPNCVVWESWQIFFAFSGLTRRPGRCRPFGNAIPACTPSWPQAVSANNQLHTKSS